MVDFFGLKAKAELEALRASHIKIEEARQQEINRLGSLLNSTIMKLLALTDRDAARLVDSRENPKEQRPVPPSVFMRRMSGASALKSSREALSAASVSE